MGLSFVLSVQRFCNQVFQIQHTYFHNFDMYKFKFLSSNQENFSTDTLFVQFWTVLQIILFAFRKYRILCFIFNSAQLYLFNLLLQLLLRFTTLLCSVRLQKNLYRHRFKCFKVDLMQVGIRKRTEKLRNIQICTYLLRHMYQKNVYTSQLVDDNNLKLRQLFVQYSDFVHQYTIILQNYQLW